MSVSNTLPQSDVPLLNRQPQTPQKSHNAAIWIKRASISCAILAVLKVAQTFMNHLITDPDCSGSYGYYNYARWWSASASYCLAEKQIEKFGQSPDNYEITRKWLIEAAQQGIQPAKSKLLDCSFYPTLPVKSQIDELNTLFKEPCACIFPWVAGMC
jgi:hypothetical protein